MACGDDSRLFAGSEYTVKLDASGVYKAIDEAHASMAGMRRFTAKKHDDNRAEIVIFDDIGDSFFGEGVTAKSVNEQLKAFGDVDEITVRINSPGGAVFDGLAIYNLLHQHPANIIVEIDGLAASAASVIAMAGDTIRMAKNALMMVHPAQSFAGGDADDLREQADLLDKITSNIVDIYTSRTGLPRGTVENLVDNDTWLTAEEALDLMLITEITPDKAIAAKAVGFLRNQARQSYLRSAPEQSPEEVARIAAEIFPPKFHENSTTDTPAQTERKQQPNNQGTQMEWFKALGYETEAEAFAAFTELKTYQNGVVSATGASSPVDAVQRLTTMTSELATAKAEIVAEKVKADAIKVDAEIDKLTSDMKLAPAQHEFFRSLNASQREAFIANAAPLVAAQAQPRALEANQVVLTAVQEKMAASTGVSRDDYIAQLVADAKKEVS